MEIRECPFCGGDRVGLSYDEYFGGKRHDKPLVKVFVKCRECGGQGHGFTASQNGTKLYGRRSMREAEREAVKWWNRRSERTCTVDPSRVDEEIGEYSHLSIEMSCGHEFTWDWLEVPDYCPYCGSKVIKE